MGRVASQLISALNPTNADSRDKDSSAFLLPAVGSIDDLAIKVSFVLIEPLDKNIKPMKKILGNIAKPILLGCLFGLSNAQLKAQQWVTFIECTIQTDNKDFLEIFNDGSWAYTTSGGQPSYGLCNGNTVNGNNYACMQTYGNPFPSPAALNNSLANWSADVISGQAPRCPNVGSGSNPDSTVSVIEHTASHIIIQLNDYGDCGSQGRVTYTLRLRYWAPAAPVVQCVSSTMPNGYYRSGLSIPITVSFNQNVTVSGSPSLQLNSGGIANYGSGSGSTNLTFTYTVSDGETSTRLDYSSSGALALNGGSITAGGITAASLTLPSPGAAGSLGASRTLVIDTAPPSLTIGAPSRTATRTNTVSYAVTYWEPNFNVSSLSPGAISLNSTFTANANVNVAGFGSNYLVTLSNFSGHGTLGISIAGGTAMDLAGNVASGAGPSASFIVDSGTWLSMDRLGHNSARLKVIGVPSAQYLIESASNLPGLNWQTFGTVLTDTNGLVSTNMNASEPQKYFRAKLP
ncbi:MAG TPA: hypothetical protein VF988_08785 [Verrucomicrobiae bacterium]